MKMRMENGELANNDKQNMQVFVKHFTALYNTHRNTPEMLPASSSREKLTKA
jgi:hypothetical protein